MNLPVNYYGLHTSPEGVMYLHQGRAAVNFIGLSTKSPFEVLVKKKACPHLINGSTPVPDRHHWGMFQRLLPDELVKELLPLPKDRGSAVPFLNDTTNELALTLATLSRMASPIYQLVHAVSKYTTRELVEELSLTNVAPIIITGVKPSDQAFMYEVANEARTLPRRILFTGDATVVIHAPLKRIQTVLKGFDPVTLASLPMESLGSVLVKRYARGEALNTDFVRKGEDA